MKRVMIVLCVVLFAVVCLGLASAQASVTTMTAYPTMVPDEQLPRGNVGDAPTGWGDSSWQGPAAGAGNKSNFHVRVGEDGNYWGQILGATATISDLASLSYWTKNSTVGEDWVVSIYTAPGSTGWFTHRFNSTLTGHIADGLWNEYTTAAITFDDTYAGDIKTLAGLRGTYGSETIEMITLQTYSNWDGFDGYVDGLTIALTDSRVGRVDFAAVPEPATIVVWSLLGLTVAGFGLLRRKRAA